MNLHLWKKPLSFIGILLGGLLPVFIYRAWYGGLGSSEIGELQSVSPFEQFALVVSLFDIKPTYLFLCTGLLLVLWERNSPPARSLFWGLVALLMGELICGMYWVVFQRELLISEHIHSYGMILEFAFILYALLEFINDRLLQNRVRSISIGIALIGMIASLLPLSVSLTQGGYYADLFGFPYSYIRFSFNQWMESRTFPIASFVFFLLAFFASRKAKETNLSQSAKIFLSAGIGLLTFPIFRLTLNILFAERLVWFEFWEETTQLILISTIAIALWQLRRAWVSERINALRTLISFGQIK